MNEQVWWYVARASGITAWALAAAAVLWGMALSTRALGSKPRAPWLLDLHRFLGALSVVFVGVHLIGLVADSYIEFGLSELLVPMASTWQPGPVAWGIASFYLLIAVEVTSLLQNRIPKAWWRRVHLASYLMFVFGTVHLLAAGTDATNPVLRWSVILIVALQVFFFVYMGLVPKRRKGADSPAARAAAARAAMAARKAEAESVSGA